MNILVTGASGFIGRNLIERISASFIYCNLHATYYHKYPKYISNIKKYAAIHQCDLSDSAQVSRLIKETNPDCIVHLAANPLTKPDDIYPSKILQDNISSTNNLAFLCKKGTKFIFLSSVVVYGDQLNCTESYNCKPTSLYGVTKATSELILNMYQNQGKIFDYSIRACATVGKYMTHGLLFDIVRKLNSDSEYLELFGDSPGTIKPYIHVNDVVTSIMQLIMAENGRYPRVVNISPNDNISVADVAKVCMEETKIHKKIKWLGNKSTWVGDNKEILIKSTLRSIHMLGFNTIMPLNSEQAIRIAVQDIL